MKTTKIISVLLFALFSLSGFSQKIVWRKKSPTPAIGYISICNHKDQLYHVGWNNDTCRVYLYHKTTDTWSLASNVPNIGGTMAVASTDSGIYTIGGQRNYDDVVNVVNMYNPEKDEWDSCAPLPTARKHLSAVAVDSMIYIIGGMKDDYNTVYSINEVYNIKTDKWETKAPIPQPKQNYSIAVLNNKIYVIGGETKEGTNIWAPTSTVYAYDIASDSWEQCQDLPTNRYWMGTIIIDGKIVCLGGSIRDNVPLDETIVYNPDLDIWSSLAAFPKPVIYMNMAMYEGKIHAAGGMGVNNVQYSDVYEGTMISEGNFIPEVYRPIPDTSIIVGKKYTYKIPDFTFIDDDALTYSCKQSNGENLPAWLKFTPSTRTFSGTPLNAENMTVMVTVTDKENVSVYDEFQITVTNATSIENKQSLIPKESMLYPNPTNGHITLSFGTPQSRESFVEIYNLQGAQVFSKTYQNTTSATIDLTGNPAGVYVVKVIADGVCYEEKVLKD
jgi:hypothetical protein